MPFRAKTKDDDSLYRCARFCYGIAGDVLEFLPHTRESQRILVNLLSGRLAASGEDFPIGVPFLADTVKCRDQHLLTNWQGSYENLAWLMVHEALANFFPRFVLDNWSAEPFLVHVPKSTGTGLVQLIRKQSFFVAYPQTTFEIMCAISGLLGFAGQLMEFEQECRPERLYFGGDFNLPDILERVGADGRSQGISAGQSPIEIISWAIRHVWTLIEQSDPEWAPCYPSLTPQQMAQIREAATQSSTPAALAAMREAADAILQAPRFRESYDELLCKCYYNEKINSPNDLIGILRKNRNLVPCIDIARDMELIRWHLRIEGEIAPVDIKTFPHRDLAHAFGGDEAFCAAIAPRILRSAEIYGVLCALRAQSEPAGGLQ